MQLLAFTFSMLAHNVVQTFFAADAVHPVHTVQDFHALHAVNVVLAIHAVQVVHTCCVHDV